MHIVVVFYCFLFCARCGLNLLALIAESTGVGFEPQSGRAGKEGPKGGYEGVPQRRAARESHEGEPQRKPTNESPEGDAKKRAARCDREREPRRGGYEGGRGGWSRRGAGSMGRKRVRRGRASEGSRRGESQRGAAMEGPPVGPPTPLALARNTVHLHDEDPFGALGPTTSQRGVHQRLTGRTVYTSKFYSVPCGVQCTRLNSTECAFLFLPKKSKFYRVRFLTHSVEFNGPPRLSSTGRCYMSKFYNPTSAPRTGDTKIA